MSQLSASIVKLLLVPTRDCRQTFTGAGRAGGATPGGCTPKLACTGITCRASAGKAEWWLLAGVGQVTYSCSDGSDESTCENTCDQISLMDSLCYCGSACTNVTQVGLLDFALCCTSRAKSHQQRLCCQIAHLHQHTLMYSPPDVLQLKAPCAIGNTDSMTWTLSLYCRCATAPWPKCSHLPTRTPSTKPLRACPQ